jgi:hypothetical protein
VVGTGVSCIRNGRRDNLVDGRQAELLERFPLTWNRHGRACPGHLDAEGTAFQTKYAWHSRALLIEITGTSPVMTSVGTSISSEHAPDVERRCVSECGIAAARELRHWAASPCRNCSALPPYICTTGMGAFAIRARSARVRADRTPNSLMLRMVSPRRLRYRAIMRRPWSSGCRCVLPAAFPWLPPG